MSRDEGQFFAEWDLKDCRSSKARRGPAPHQKDALGKLNAWYGKLQRDGSEGGILVLPTGGGKTFTAVHFLCNGPLSDGYKVLWLAHTHHLLEQAFHTFAGDLLGGVREPRSSLRLRVVSGTPGHYPPRDIRASDDVVIGTLQTITNAHREKSQALLDYIDAAEGKIFVVFDEAHHAPAPSYRALLLGLRERGAPVLGLTATPTYSDEAKKGWLKKLFPQGILAQARASELMAQRILARPRFEPVPTEVAPDFDEADYQKWLGTYRDIPENVVSALAENAERNAFIASTYANERAKYGKTIIFSDRWYQCEAIVSALAKRGVKADAVYSHVDAHAATVEGRRRRDRDENARVIKRFRDGEIDVLVNVRMLTEGTDLPDAQTVFLTRQTTSQILLTQMVGRALRGPKFGGTEEAYIVSFVDEWRQQIRWAEYDQLGDGPLGDDADRRGKHPPIQLISIDLVKRLAGQMDSGVNITAAPFTSLMPSGWYCVRYDALVAGTDDIETREHLVMVFDDERRAFERAIKELAKWPPKALAEEGVTLEASRSEMETLRASYFEGAARDAADLHHDLFHVARHIAQGNPPPTFFPFEVRQAHDLDAIVVSHLTKDLRLSEVNEALRAEYSRTDRYWRSLFPRFEQMRSYYDACLARATSPEPTGPVPTPKRGPAPTPREPSEEEKAQVKRRDGGRCLACGATRYLQVDHVTAWYHGGSHDLANLQTLCKTCNARKSKKSLRFTSHVTALSGPPGALAHFDDPDDAGDRDHWERFLRRSFNFTYECAAVSSVTVGGRGASYYNWRVELVGGNSPAWVTPHLKALVGRIQEARAAAGKPEIESLTVSAPGEADAVYPRPAGR